jgi:hypothetical protein
MSTQAALDKPTNSLYSTGAADQLTPIMSTVREDPFYVLSMGHRIHTLGFDPRERKFTVNRFTSETGTNEAVEDIDTYAYDVWVPQVNRFQTLSQKFHRFPHPEFNWNLLDEVLLGNQDRLSENLKAKRIRFAVVPELEATATRASEEAFFAKFDLLLQFITNYCQNKERFHVVREWVNNLEGNGEGGESGDGSSGGDGDKDTTQGRNASRPKVHSKAETKLWIRPSNVSEEDPKWIYLIHDSYIKTSQIFHIGMQWVACDSWFLDDFINVLFRRCTNWGLRIAQIPEYFCTPNLAIHPFRAQPFIEVPQLRQEHRELWESATVVVERLFFRFGARLDLWVQDHDNSTDWAGMGLESTSTSDAASTITDAFGGGKTIHRNWRNWARGRVKDRQYFHRMCLASVRIGVSGMVWLMNR